MKKENADNLSIKTVLVGETGVGKTSIIKQFAKNEFDPECTSSICCHYNSKTIYIKQIEKEIKFDLWDTAGQEIYRSLARIFYKDAKIIIFVYDITNKKSFEGIQKYWYKQILANSDKDTILGLVGNKSDLYNFQVIDDEEAIKYAESIGAIFQTTSAKTNIGINTLFKNIARKLIDPNFDYKKEEENEKQLYNIKKENKSKKEEELFDENENTSISSVKLYKESIKKQQQRKCC